MKKNGFINKMVNDEFPNYSVDNVEKMDKSLLKNSYKEEAKDLVDGTPHIYNYYVNNDEINMVKTHVIDKDKVINIDTYFNQDKEWSIIDIHENNMDMFNLSCTINQNEKNKLFDATLRFSFTYVSPDKLKKYNISNNDFKNITNDIGNKSESFCFQSLDDFGIKDLISQICHISIEDLLIVMKECELKENKNNKKM